MRETARPAASRASLLFATMFRRCAGFVLAGVLLALLYLGVGCGGDSPSSPTTAGSPTAPPPAPPPAPSVRDLLITTAPFDPLGYAVSETIGIQVTFSEAVTVAGSPRVALGIGEDTRFAAWNQDASAGAFVVFRYVVTLEDRDKNGISVDADALDVADGAIRNADRVEANLDIGDHAIADHGDHLVLGAPPERQCANERSLARAHTPRVVRQWDGRPFRVDMVRNFPGFVTDADLRELLDPIGRLADQIEAQLGYGIVEMGDLIDVLNGARPGWDQDFERYWRERRLVSEPGQLVAFYMNADNDSWGGQGSPMSAHPCCGTMSFNKRSLGPLWTGNDPCCPNDTRARETIVHEVFHLFGFKHALDQPDRVGVVMSLGALDLPWRRGPTVFHAAWTDIDALRCIFPEGG